MLDEVGVRVWFVVDRTRTKAEKTGKYSMKIDMKVWKSVKW